MRITIICTGTELLKGTTVNTNLSFIGQQLSEAGIVPARALVIGDEPEAMLAALESSVTDSDLIITTGGLGPTNDDLTRKVVCDFLKLGTARDPELENDLKIRWQRRYAAKPAPENYLAQADIPENTVILPNAVGTAPGLWVKGRNKNREIEIILLPGPPNELNPMFRNETMPALRKKITHAVFTSSFMIAATAELLVQEKVEPLIAALPLTAAYCASIEGVKTFLSGDDRELVESKTREAAGLFGNSVLAGNGLSLPEEVSARLKKHALSFGTAESCTGGMIAAAITDLPGSSQIFSG
ncbi:MAG: molybdopterin-binding protein, partial [Victivallales bacterium]|nr:molybdopterin-binding protein [Victivallales bacterium]